MQTKKIKGTTTYTVEVEIAWEVEAPVFVNLMSVVDAFDNVTSLDDLEIEVGDYIVNDCEQSDLDSLDEDEGVTALVWIHQRIDNVIDSHTDITDEGGEGE